jgi:histidinol-phosphate aminotransferase
MGNGVISTTAAFSRILHDLPPYVPGRPIESVAQQYGLDPARIAKLASNENPLGTSTHAQAAIRDSVGTAHRYPDADNEHLKSALSRHLAIAADRILPVAGSSELIVLVARAVLGPGLSAILSQYSFFSYALAVRAAGGIAKIIPAGTNFGHDLERMAQAIDDNTRLVILASPNNPTGTVLSKEELAAFIARVPPNILVVIDEAYREYVDPERTLNCDALMSHNDNVLILRTFSKVHGLAGLRVGYGLGDPSVLKLIRRLQTPFSVSSVAQTAAAASLQDSDFIRASVTLNSIEREQLAARLYALGRRFIPSQGNFVLVHVGDAQNVYEALLRCGIITRPVANYGLEEWLRVSIGLPDQNARFTEALAGALSIVNGTSTPQPSTGGRAPWAAR